jgi:hypothetical protein
MIRAFGIGQKNPRFFLDNFLWFFTVSQKTLTQKPRILRGYLIRLAHGYMDGGMDSLAEEERNNRSELVADVAINRIHLISSSNARSAVLYSARGGRGI